jgi:hypothetical protein
VNPKPLLDEHKVNEGSDFGDFPLVQAERAGCQGLDVARVVGDQNCGASEGGEKFGQQIA